MERIEDIRDLDLIPVEVGVINMTHAERDIIWGAVVERRRDWNQFVLAALLEAAQR